MFQVGFADAGFGSSSDLPPSYRPHSPFRLVQYKSTKRGYFFPPLASFVLPGLDQWVEDQRLRALFYTGSALIGYGAWRHGMDEREALNVSLYEPIYPTNLGKGDAHTLLGGLLSRGAGRLSAYHSFRTAVRSQRGYGNFTFLTVEERLEDLLLARFKFSYLARPATWIPLALAFPVLAVAVRGQEFLPTFSGTLVSGLVSYHAGPTEEAMFRGWILPTVGHWTDSNLAATLVDSSLFALAHVNERNKLPVPQLIGGLYLGWLTQNNQCSISEGIFVHAWWDVIVMGGLMAFANSIRQPSLKADSLPTLWLPPCQYSF